jgi:hypothetical protein
MTHGLFCKNILDEIPTQLAVLPLPLSSSPHRRFLPRSAPASSPLTRTLQLPGLLLLRHIASTPPSSSPEILSLHSLSSACCSPSAVGQGWNFCSIHRRCCLICSPTARRISSSPSVFFTDTTEPAEDKSLVGGRFRRDL